MSRNQYTLDMNDADDYFIKNLWYHAGELGLFIYDDDQGFFDKNEKMHIIKRTKLYAYHDEYKELEKRMKTHMRELKIMKMACLEVDSKYTYRCVICNQHIDREDNMVEGIWMHKRCEK